MGAICRIVYLYAEQSEGKKGAEHKDDTYPWAAVRTMEANTRR